jgi:hypothetical protein
MNSFEAGFIKCAEEYGVPVDQALHMLKRASDYPGTSSLFKELPDDEYEHHEEAAGLADLIKQDLIDQQMTEGRRRIQM